MTDITLRASGLPMAFKCAGSVRRAPLLVDAVHEAATIGTASHEALRNVAETGAVDWESIPSIADSHGVDVDEVRMLTAMGARLWAEVAESFPEAITEVELAVDVCPGVTLTGHADVLSVGEKVARLGDWKTGRKDSDYAAQMRGYGALVLLDNPDLDEVTVTILWVREGEIENYTMTRRDALVWLRALVADVVEWDGVYHPGSHCEHCRRSHDCEAANALVRRDVAAVADKGLVAAAEAELALMKPEQIVEIHRKAALVQRYAKRVTDAIKAHVAEHGDIVADGVRLTIDTENRRKVDPIAAWPVLEAAGFKDEDFARCIDLRISRVEKTIAQKAGRGKGAAAVRDLAAALEGADAVSVKETKKLAAKRA